MNALRALRPETPEDIRPLLSKDPNRGLHLGEAVWLIPGGGDQGPEPPMSRRGYFQVKGRIIGSSTILNAFLHSTWGSTEAGSLDAETVVSFSLTQIPHWGDDPVSLAHFWFRAPETDLKTEDDSLLIAAHGMHRYINGYSEEESVTIQGQVEDAREPELPSIWDTFEALKERFPDDPAFS